jgi:hypothetical protein
MSAAGKAKHLIGAIRDFLLDQDAIGEPLAGGVVNAQASRDQPLPYLVIEAKDLSTLRILGNREVATVRVECAVYAASAAEAETIGDLVRDAILPPGPGLARQWVPLPLATGWVDVNRQPAGGDSIEVDPEQRAAFGRDVWTCRRPISWTISRG